MQNLKETNLLVYIHEVNSRAEYIFSFIFDTILGIKYKFTIDNQEFIKSELPKINYSEKNNLPGLYLKPHPLLFEKGIRHQLLEEVEFRNQKFCFETDKESFMSFDPFAFSFYVLTRYEEYLPTNTDNYDRFPDLENILIKLNLEHKPIVDNIAYILAEFISEKFSGFKIKQRHFNFITTIDIDNAWAYKNKNVIVSVGAGLKNLFSGNFKELKSRIAVILGLEKDPYDTYNYILELYKTKLQNIIFFFLVGNRDKFDKNISHKNKAFRRLVAKLASVCECGIHPSFASALKPSLIVEEKQRLEEIIKKPVYNSRQHFLKIKLPSTYRLLISSGIANDFTMGFASTVGFRAGTCTPFYFFDLSQNVCTNLMLKPFQCMDVSLRNYMQYTSGEAETKVLELMSEVKKVNGTFISLWHNESLKNSGEWASWNSVFELIYQQAVLYSIESEDYVD